jgi:uncharacterized protein
MIIDIHGHMLHPWLTPENTRRFLNLADRFGIEKLCFFLNGTLKRYRNQREIRESNNIGLDLVKKWPKRFIPFCYLNPRLARKHCIEELNRCFDRGMRGIKLWLECAADNPLVFPIVERAIELNIPVLQHTWLLAGGTDEDHSTPDQFAKLARRYPEAKLIMGHTGGNWEVGVRLAQPLKNVWIDTCGGNPTQGFLEYALRFLSPERILFGSDFPVRGFASAVAKVEGAKMSARVKKMILGENARALLGL